ncbi:MAG: RNA polymerase sigma factor RpoD, partial [Deltaproteobacteria bacterium]|nr:RNA polymerase sigma factor RpoD [Deltaproteobacteria bacterium]
MSNDSDMVSLKRLINIGKDKGYITYEELNDDLPEDIVSSEHIDNLMMMFEELDIMVIDEASKEEIEKSKKLKKRQEKALEKGNFQAEVSETAAGVSDPVKMYLKEMGCISLLTREGEVEIAKKIEAGEQEALDSLLKCCVGIEYIIELGERLKEGGIKLKDVINDLDDEDSHTQLSERRETILNIIDNINKLYEEYRGLKRETQKKNCSVAKKKKSNTKMKTNHRKMVKLISTFKLEKGQLDNMV